MKDGFVRVGSATPELKVADPLYNAEKIIELVLQAQKVNIKILFFPQLALTSNSVYDLVKSQTLIRQSEEGLRRILEATKDTDILFFVSLPLAANNATYIGASACLRGEVLGFVGKQSVTSDHTLFKPAPEIGSIVFNQVSYDFGHQLLFQSVDDSRLVVGVEFNDDVYRLEPPSLRFVKNGATIIGNLAAEMETAAGAHYRYNHLKQYSATTISGYVFTNAGISESSSLGVYAGDRLIFENGRYAVGGEMFTHGLTYGDLDLDYLTIQRRQNKYFATTKEDGYRIPFSLEQTTLTYLERQIERTPFVPADPLIQHVRSELIFTILSTALAKRLKHVNSKDVYLGLSGGLDSTLALLVILETFHKLDYDPKHIHTIIMPGFGTSSQTHKNAHRLAKLFKTNNTEIDIKSTVTQHFQDISHPLDQHDTTFENAQARYRTMILFDKANQTNGLVIGTGDLSEIALGWSTYNGDTMSSYNVNANVPKTLVKHLVKHYATNMNEDSEIKEVLLDVVNTIVSPELVPIKDDEIQATENHVGPYVLVDFFLFFLIHLGFQSSKVLRLATQAFRHEYTEDEIRHWLEIFIRRFFNNQFKRTAAPDGPKIGSLTLSGRDGYQMVSDATYQAWLNDLND